MSRTLRSILYTIKLANRKGRRGIATEILPQKLVKQLVQLGYTVKRKSFYQKRFHVITWKHRPPIHTIVIEKYLSNNEVADENQSFSCKGNTRNDIFEYPNFDDSELAYIKIVSEFHNFIDFNND